MRPTTTRTSDQLRNLRWGVDDEQVWHIVPYFSIDTYEVLLEYSCTNLTGSIHVGEIVYQPPAGATLCPICRGHFTKKLVEEL